jgi:hypothetical protein
MNRRQILKATGAGIALPAIAALQALAQPATGDATVFELRVYHCAEGKLDTLMARFRDHTITIFNRFNMHSVAYWVPTDEPLKGRTLFYILRHPSREAATANWAAFNSDPEWKQVRAVSEANGKLVEKVDSTFLQLTDFSPKI